jgi:hypothetical protein
MKKVLINFSVLVVSAVVGLLLCEFASRLVLNPADYFDVGMVKDEVLGAAPSPSARAGFDAWGFRNREVPETAEIVAVGDSHTYGNTARMEDSWPYVLGRLTGRRVYNMGMGGYGPNQYYYLSKTKALSLKPRIIIWGVYMGDDFENAFSITYGLDYWAYLREHKAGEVNFNIWESETAPRPSWSKSIRVWLSRHSVIYQLLFHASLSGRAQGEFQIRNASQLYPGVATTLNLPEKNILEAFRPKNMLSRLDQDDPNVREGMRITFKLLADMHDICEQNRVQFVVVVIPTKEMVFSDYLEHNSKIALSDVLDKLAVNERLARERTFKFLTDSNISYVDPLPALKRAVEHELYARTAGDMHPSKNGYRVIAEAASEALKPDFTRRLIQQRGRVGSTAALLPTRVIPQ